jgi:hypothetical protein
MTLFARFPSIVFCASLFPLAVSVAACSSAPADASSSSNQDIVSNQVDPHSTVRIFGTSSAPLQMGCMGTALTGSWVLTSQACATAAAGQTFQVCQGTNCMGVVASHTHPTLPIAMLQLRGSMALGGIPQLATKLPNQGNVVFGAGFGGKQGIFTLSSVSGDSITLASTTSASGTQDDRGGGAYLFDDTEIFGVIQTGGSSGLSVTSILGAEAWILGFTGSAPVCGNASCGGKYVDGQYFSCGQCVGSMVCSVNQCVFRPADPCQNKCKLPFVCDSGTKTCVDPLNGGF